MTEPCTRPTRTSDPAGLPCPACGHAAMTHPGFFDQKRTMTACLVCELLALRDDLAHPMRGITVP